MQAPCTYPLYRVNPDGLLHPQSTHKILKSCLWGLAGLTAMVAIPPLLGIALITGGAALFTAAFGAFKVALVLGIDCLLSGLAARIAYKTSLEFFKKAVEN